nr:MAG: putative maturation protein [Leviviridae sp.]
MCGDTVGYRNVPNPLTIEKGNGVAWRFTGITGAWNLTNFYTVIYPSLGYAPNPDLPSDSDLVTRALAVSNPNQPIADVGQIAQDVWDFPKLAKDVMHYFSRSVSSGAGSIARHAGSDYLGVQFGLAPLVGDLNTALDFVDSVEKRKQVIAALQDHGISRTTQSGTYLGAQSGRWQQYGFSLYGNAPLVSMAAQQQRKVWMSTRFKLNPTSPYLKANKPSPLDIARACLALDPHNASTIWQLMPWTWLIDWFANTRDVFNAGRNTLDTSATECCVMTTSGIALVDFHVDDMQGCVGSFELNDKWGFWRKSRNPYPDPSPSLSVHLPFLDGGQLSILAALAQSRSRIRAK